MERMRNPEDAIKKWAIGQNALVAGIASASDIDQLQAEGHRPSDILPSAKSVIVIGSLPFAGTWKIPDYKVVGEVAFQCNEELYRIAYHMADYIESKYGYESLFPPPDSIGNWSPLLDIKRCAEMAGLGSRSLAGEMILHPEYGFLYFAITITSMPLVPDGPLKDPVCPAPSCVRLFEKIGTTPCMNACPDCLSGTIKDGRIVSSRYDRNRCATRAQSTSPPALQRQILGAAEETNPAKRKMIVLGDYFSRSVKSLSYRSHLDATCMECWRPCPVGMKYRVKK